MYEEFSKRFRKALGESGMKQKDLAERLNMPAQTINSYATGRAKPPEDKLTEICNALNIKREELEPEKSSAKQYVQTGLIAGTAAVLGAPASLVLGAAAVAGFLSGMKSQKVSADETLRENFCSVLEMIQRGDEHFLAILDRILPAVDSEDYLLSIANLSCKSGVGERTLTYYAGLIRGILGNTTEGDEWLYQLLIRLLYHFASLAPKDQKVELERYKVMLPR